MAVSGWTPCRLGDLVEIKHGWPFKSELFAEEMTGQPIVVSVGNFRYTGGFRFAETSIKEYRGSYPKEFELAPRDMLVIMTCQTLGGEILGIPARVPDDGRVYLHNQRLGKVVIRDSAGVNPDFLYWLFLWGDFNRELATSASGTKILHTAPSRIEAFNFYMPPMPEQRAIAHILGPLDDKIELNRRMSETLEAMARALFKSWFVDFDPVRAKAEGRDPGLPKPLADLFPDSFEDSELGEIPKGWPKRPLKEVLKEVNERVGGAEVPEYSSTNDGLHPRSERFTKKLSVSNANNKVIRRGCLVFGLSRRVLNFGLMRDDIGSVSPAYRVLAVDHTSIVPDLLEQMMRIRPAYFYSAVSASSREGQSVSLEGLGLLSFVQPSKAAQEAYYRVTDSICRRVRSLENESRTLADLRDTLLPKLISGDLRVQNAEKMVGAVA